MPIMLSLTTKIWRKFTNSPPNYRYSPLSTEQIRILKLLPGQFDDPLVITLQECNICAVDDIYEALSYAWIDPKRSIDVECNGAVLKITASLEIALRRLRLQTQFRVLWVDAICINQDDAEERAQQVPLMREIYPRAAKVVIWLGEADGKTDLALMVIRQWAEFNRKYRNDSDATRFTKFEEQFAMKPGYRDSLGAVGELTHRSWFNRCWTFQEILLSTSAELFVGQQRLTWGIFHYALVVFPFHLLADEVLNFNALFMCYGKAKMEDAALFATPISISRNLSRLLQITRNFVASDPRDKIFSMLGVATLKNPSIFKPKYSMSVSKTFISFTIAMIRDENSLNVLMSTGEPHRDKDLPSWCPDWKCSRGVTLIGYYDYISYAVNSSFRPSLTHLQMNGRYELVLEGALIDVVKEVYDLEELENELKASLKERDSCYFTPVFTKFVRTLGLHNYLLRDEHSEAALLRILTADHWFFGTHVQSSYKELWFPTHLRFWDLKRNKLNKRDNGPIKLIADSKGLTTPESAALGDSGNIIACSREQGPTPAILNYNVESPFTHSVIDKVYRQSSPYYIVGQDFEDAKHVDAQTLTAIAKETISQALFFFKGKRILITEHGYVALGTAETRVGDSLCSLWGADVPFVIRKSYGRGKKGDADYSCKIVGECYIDGLMYGEIFRTLGEGEITQKHVQGVPPLVSGIHVKKFRVG